MSDKKTPKRTGGLSDEEKAIVNKYKRQRTLVLAICLLLVGWSVFSIASSRMKCNQIAIESQGYKDKLQALENEKAKLQAEKEKSQSLEYIEKAAREKLKMIKPGEVLYMINDNSEKKVDTKSTKEKSNTEKKENSEGKSEN